MLHWGSANWLTEERLRVYPRLLICLYAVGFFAWWLLADGLVDIEGRPLGTDFISFYTAGKLALAGLAPEAYDTVSHFALQQSIIGSDSFNHYSFSYPPIFLLILVPLATLPYLVALVVWQLLTLGFFILMIRKLSGHKEAMLIGLAFPAVFLTLGYGQNAFLTTGLLAGALFYIDRRLVIAGILIGLLTFKPQLGVLIPFVLIFTGRWKVFLIATCTFLFLILISYLAFGLETWQAFWDGRALINKVLNGEIVSYSIMQSMFTGVRTMGVGVATAYLLHGIIATIVLVVVLWLWSKPVDMRIKFSALAIGTLMMSPYILNYDLTVLAIVISCLSAYGLENGFRAGQINLIFVAWLAPIFVRPLNTLIPFPWTTVLLLLLLLQLIVMTNSAKRSVTELQSAN